MLTQAQIDQYNEIGAIVVPDILTPEEVLRLRRVTDEFRRTRPRRHRATTRSTTSKTATRPDNPRVRRIKTAHLHHPAYARLVRHPKIIAVLQRPVGPRHPLRHRQAEHEVRRVRRAGGVAPGLGFLPAHQR